MDEKTYRAELVAQGYNEPVVVEWDAGYSMDEHVHEFDAKLFVLEGQMTATLGDKTIVCNPGDTFAYVAGTPHSEASGPNGAKFLAARK